MRPFIIILLSCCLLSAKCQSHKGELRCIEATSIHPSFTLTGEVNKYDTSRIRVYYLGTKRLYDLQYQYTLTENQTLKTSEIRRHLVAFDIDSAFGYDLNQTSGIVKRVNLDSLFKKEWIAQNKIYPMITTNIAVLTESRQNKDSGILVEAYLLKNKSDSVEVGSLRFTYETKFHGIDISLSKELDSIKNMTLSKTEIVSFPRYFKESNFTMAKYQLGSTLREIQNFDQKKILSYFKMLKQ